MAEVVYSPGEGLNSPCHYLRERPEIILFLYIVTLVHYK